MKKRIVSLMTAALMALSLAACGGGAAKPAEEVQKEETEEAVQENTETPEAEIDMTAQEPETETAPEEDSIEQLVADIASFGPGTAGAQLKATDLAVRFISLYASGQEGICDPQAVISSLEPEDKDKFIENFTDIIYPIVQGILLVPDQFGGVFEDLGISQEFNQLVSETLTEDDIRVFTEFADALKES